MPRYIDADERKQQIASFAGMFTDELGFVVSLEAVLGAFDSAPTADIVEVVRCKDCVYCDLDGRCEAPENGLIREFVKPDDYCSYGRKSNGDER